MAACAEATHTTAGRRLRHIRIRLYLDLAAILARVRLPASS
jgi:hypothetical protein